MSIHIIMICANVSWPIKQFVDDVFVTGRIIICKQGLNSYWNNIMVR